MAVERSRGDRLPGILPDLKAVLAYFGRDGTRVKRL
jgi:hypothetical protein